MTTKPTPLEGEDELRDKCAEIQLKFKIDDKEWKILFGNDKGLYGFVQAITSTKEREATTHMYTASHIRYALNRVLRSKTGPDLIKEILEDLGDELAHLNLYISKDKYCPKCKTTKPKDGFSRSTIRRDGLDGHCKKCRRVAYGLWLDKVKNTEEYRQRQRTNQALYTQRHPERGKAHLLARRHKERLMADACESCGTKERLHMHHPDYSKPLEIITLCVPCHEAVHHGVTV